MELYCLFMGKYWFSSVILILISLNLFIYLEFYYCCWVGWFHFVSPIAVCLGISISDVIAGWLNCVQIMVPWLICWLQYQDKSMIINLILSFSVCWLSVRKDFLESPVIFIQLSCYLLSCMYFVLFLPLQLQHCETDFSCPNLWDVFFPI